MNHIVVGVDGSAASIEALAWSASEARLRRLPLRVVTAWTYPGFAALPMTSAPPSSKQLAHEAGQVVDEAVHRLADVLLGVDVERVIEEGDPATVLLRAAHPGDLLVVGARGLGGIRRVLLGSVSRQCSEHARCPVVIIHSSATAAA